MSDRIEDLVERVRKASGPDRQLEWDVADFLGLIPEHRVMNVGWDHSWYRHPGETILHRCPGSDQFAGVESWAPPAITSSIDASVALAEGISHEHGRKLICFFCAGGQLLPHNADETDPDYHPLAKIDNSVTVGWLSHVAFFKPGGASETYGPDRYERGANASLAILAALLSALAASKGSGRT